MHNNIVISMHIDIVRVIDNNAVILVLHNSNTW